MIRMVTTGADGRKTVLLGLEPQNLSRIREGQPVKVNLRHLVPGRPPIEDLPDVDVVVFFAGTDEQAILARSGTPSG